MRWPAWRLLPYALKLRPRIEDYAGDAEQRPHVPLIGVDMLADAAADSRRTAPQNFNAARIHLGRQDCGPQDRRPHALADQ